MNGRDPMKGRHNVGMQRVNTGKTRGGGSEPGGNHAITGVSSSSPSRTMQPKAPILNDAKATSLDLEKRLRGRAPQPFNNTGGAATSPTPASPRGAKPGLEPKGIYAGKSGNTVGAKALPSGGAVGYSKLPNQSFQIGGRMSAGSNPRKVGAQNLSKVKRGSAFFGDN
jgi:hypothetical protein